MEELACRMYGHHWDSKTISWDQVHYFDSLECEVCGTVRTDTIRRRTGKTIRRNYKYADKYLTPNGETKKTRTEIKKEFFDATAS